MSDSTIKDGGPAFPMPVAAGGPENYARLDELVACDKRHLLGMSLRDYFAAKAMQSMFNGFAPGGGTVPDVYYVCAREAYAVADAMLKARAK